MYSVSCFNLLGALFGEAKPIKAPCGDGTAVQHFPILNFVKIEVRHKNSIELFSFNTYSCQNAHLTVSKN